MADWSANVSPTALYVTLLSLLAARDIDAVTLGKAAYTNPPDGAIQWLRASSKFQEWNNGGAVYVDMVVAIAGGGTGASTAATARTNLGLGNIATQDAGAVAITGGAVAANLTGSTNIPAAGLTGTIAQARLGTGSGGIGGKFLADDQTYKAISTALRNAGIVISAVKSADFTADPTSFDVYPLSGTHTVTLPTVVGLASPRVTFILRSATTWTIGCHAGETILGASSYTFNWGQYASITLQADANSGLWDII